MEKEIQKLNIKLMHEENREEVLSMMKTFYSSDAVLTNGSDEIFEADFNACTGDNPCLEGYMLYFVGETAGYAMIAKSFATEFGKNCIWFEDLYLKPEFRGKQIVPNFIENIKRKYPNCVFRLEVEKENTHAVHVYKKCGFENIPYFEMIIK